MQDSVYRVIHVVGSSPNSWEEASTAAIAAAGKHLKDLRVAEVKKLDLRIEDGKPIAFRARLYLSFRYDEGFAHGE